MVAELEEYIIKNELYRTVQVRTPSGDQMLQMSGGDLLTRIFRLAAERDRLTSDQQARLTGRGSRPKRRSTACARAFTSGSTVRSRRDWTRSTGFWTSACWIRSAAERSTRSRCATASASTSSGSSLAADLTPELKTLLNRVDERIRLIVKSADFIWDQRLESVFPREKSWYLYVRP